MKFYWRKKIRLPGFTIRVAFTDDRGLQGKFGDWDYDIKKAAGTIRIHTGASKSQQRLTFAHEMQHAMVDYLHYIASEHLEELEEDVKPA